MLGSVAAIPPLAIRLFGCFEASVHGHPFPKLRSRKDCWLLALLVLNHGRPVSRQWLSQTLWPFPDYSEDLAKGYLRRSLSLLRRALGAEAWRVEAPDYGTVRLRVDGADVDTIVFADAVTRDDIKGRNSAIELYRGPLLTECTEPWIVYYREERASQFREVLLRAGEQATNDDDHLRAASYYKFAVRLEPDNEMFRRKLMTALAESGDFSGSAEVFHDLRSCLHSGSRVPNPETTALFQQIRSVARQRAKAVERVNTTRFRSQPVEGTPLQRLQAGAKPFTLPAFDNTLIGRSEAVRSISGRLIDRRLITLSGPGGVGKTRLAVELAWEQRGNFMDGCFFVDLTPLHEPERVITSFMEALGLAAIDGNPTPRVVADRLRDREMLIILDNCEHVLPTVVDLVREIVIGCPEIRVLATSRRSLGIVGEVDWRVSELGLAPANELSRLDEDLVDLVGASSSVRLFLDRVVDVQSNFTLTHQNVRTVDRVCRHLDGIPLALEIAAARMRINSIESLAEGIEHSLTTLHDSRRIDRHKSVHAVIDWSFRLLNPEIRRFLAMLSIFRGGFALEAAYAVCPKDLAGGDTDRIQGWIEELVDHSLIVADLQQSSARFRLLEVIRQFLDERVLCEWEEHQICELKSTHAAWYGELANTARFKLRSFEQFNWLQRLDTEKENLITSLHWYIHLEDAPNALAMCNSLAHFWEIRSYYRREIDAFAKSLSLPGEPGPARAEALAWFALFADFSEDSETALAQSEKALQLTEAHSDPRLTTHVLKVRGWALRHADPVAALAYLEQGLEIACKIDDPLICAELYSTLGFHDLYLGDPIRAEASFQKGLALARQLGDQWLIAELAYHLGIIHAERHDFSLAADLLMEAHDLQSRLDDRPGIAITLIYLADIAFQQGDLQLAQSYFLRGFATARTIGRSRSMCAALQGLASLTAHAGDFDLAARVFGRAASLRDEATAALLPSMSQRQTSFISTCRERLGEETYKRLFDEGMSMTLDRIVLAAGGEQQMCSVSGY